MGLQLGTEEYQIGRDVFSRFQSFHLANALPLFVFHVNANVLLTLLEKRKVELTHFPRKKSQERKCNRISRPLL